MTAVSVHRPLRRDAAANRERLLDAAAEVFAAQGLEAGVEDIARVAGVGIGTLYRRFPTKEALIAALVHDVLERMRLLAEDAAQLPDGTGLESFLEAVSAYQADHPGCLPRLWTNDSDHELVAQVRQRIAHLLKDAKQHGRVRSDITGTDITVMLWALRGVIETTRNVAPEAWRRHLEILVTGLRPTGQHLQSHALTRSQVDRIITTG